MTIAWPSTLPPPMIDGYGFDPASPTVKTDMDAGPGRVRRRFTARPTEYKAAWIFTQQQLATFESWFDLDAMSGAAWFSVVAWNGKGGVSVTARIPSGTFAVTKRPGLMWGVSVSLEIRDRPIMTATELAPYL